MFDVQKVRLDFPILKRKINGLPLVYLDNAATSHKPTKVIEAEVDFYENHNANIHRGVHTLSEEATSMTEEARTKVKNFIGAKSEKEIIYVRNATEAINLVMYSYGETNLKSENNVVISLMEHHSNLVTWQMLCKKMGAGFRVIDVDNVGKLKLSDGGVREEEGVMRGGVADLVDEKTLIVAITAVSNVLGTINDLKTIVSLVRQKAPGAKILVDGSQMVPHMKVNVSELDIDFLAFSGHKMLGPTGIGVLWGRQELLEGMPPFLYGGDMISEVNLAGTTWNELPFKYEAGTPNIAGQVALGAAIDYLNDLGMDNVRLHERQLVEFALEKFTELEAKGLVTIYGPRDAAERGGVITFNVTGVHAHDTAQVLDRYGIAIRSGQHCGAPLTLSLGEMATARASFYVYTTKEEISFLVEKIAEVKNAFKI